MNRQNAKEMAIYISTNRKLKYDKVMEGKEYVSIRFYYLFEKFKYSLWVDIDKTKGSWEFNQYIFDTYNVEDMTVKYLQEQQETIEAVDWLVDCTMEKYRTE